MAEGMLRSNDVHMVPNNVTQIPFDWLGDLTLILDQPSTSKVKLTLILGVDHGH